MLSPSLALIIAMPHKHNADRRHHIAKMSFKVQNWRAYEAGLRRRGSLTLWIEEAALECWQTTGPSGQARYREAAIQTPDAAHGVQAGVAPDRGLDDIGADVDGSDDFSA
jgi:hypothetical protein